MNAGWMKALKPTVFCAALLPLAYFLWRIFVSQRGIESTGYLINHTGAWSMYLLCIGLAVTPARKLFAWPWLARLRGMLGLFAFFYVCLHVFIVSWLEHDFDPALVWHHLSRTSANVMDAIAFFLLIPLALTSNQATKRLLGGARWKRLHSMVYVIVPLAAARFWAGALTSGQWGETIAFGIIIATLLGIRLYWWIRQPQYA